MTGSGNIGPFGSAQDIDTDHGKRRKGPPPNSFFNSNHSIAPPVGTVADKEATPPHN